MPDGWAETGKTVRLLIWMAAGAALLYWYYPLAAQLAGGAASGMSNCNMGF